MNYPLDFEPAVFHAAQPGEILYLYLFHCGASNESCTVGVIGQGGPVIFHESFSGFFSFFQTLEIYEDQLEASGFQDNDIRRIDFEMAFFKVTAVKRQMYRTAKLIMRNIY
jgi:hypothetical protein